MSTRLALNSLAARAVRASTIGRSRTPQHKLLLTKGLREFIHPLTPGTTWCRAYQNLSQPPPQPTSTSSPTTPPAAAPIASTSTSASLEPGNLPPAEQRLKDWQIIKRLLVNIWPAGDWGVRGRVVAGMGLLVSAKVILSNEMRVPR
jgi:hypothetical protein